MSPPNPTPTLQVRGQPFCLTSAEKGALSKFVNKHRQPADGLIKLWAAQWAQPKTRPIASHEMAELRLYLAARRALAR